MRSSVYPTPSLEYEKHAQILNPYERLPEVGDVLHPPPPIVLHVHREDQHLMVASLTHPARADLSHPQYELMDHAFELIVKLTKGNRLESLVEGRRLGLPRGSLQTAVTWYGERGWQELKSAALAVPVESADTPNFGESVELLEEFSPEVVLFYYVYRHIAQWYRQAEAMQYSFDQYLELWIENYKRRLLATGNPAAESIRRFNLGDLHVLHQTLLGKPFIPSIDQYYETLENTVKFWQTDNPVQEVALVCAIKRLQHLLATLDRRWQQGRNIFTAWGWQHVYAMLQQESLLPFGDVEKLELVHT